ncbi:MFS transporter [Amycolatopsis sp. PS_44_ISF1]|uniref:MFS transporter n=1 Tax=Amycolatopsis sp. PS_44_ISF1 TaxID=2974917 RepID=UPI0028DFC355|nr:MFS transporter [Amycolatopsis sp. PS_44_ISF1]MDT8916010.1 MFS transporter [Amycolatopsis sp. PS_44_ISF1]
MKKQPKVAVEPTRPAGSAGDRGFRWFWFGETTSKIGSSMTAIAMPLVAVVALNASTFTVGVLRAAVWLPWLLVGLPAGAWIDRLRKRPVMLICDAVSFVLFLSVPVAAWLGLLTSVHLVAVALMAGAASVFFTTAYQSYLPLLVDKEFLPAANAKLQGSESAAQFAGPGLAGLVAQFLGAVVGILADALSFVVSAICLLRVRVHEPRRKTSPDEERSLRRDIREGLGFIRRDPYLRVLATYGGVANFAESIMGAVLVVFLIRTVGVSPGITGVLIAVTSLGGVIGAMISSKIANRFGTARAMLICEGVSVPFGLLTPLTTAGAGLTFFVVGQVFYLSGIIASNIIGGSFRQRYTPAHLLGRTTATMRLIGQGGVPLGALTGGVLGELIGLRSTIWISVIGTTLSVCILFLSPIRRRRDLPDAPEAI